MGFSNQHLQMAISIENWNFFQFLPLFTKIICRPIPYISSLLSQLNFKLHIYWVAYVARFWIRINKCHFVLFDALNTFKFCRLTLSLDKKSFLSRDRLEEEKCLTNLSQIRQIKTSYKSDISIEKFCEKLFINRISIIFDLTELSNFGYHVFGKKFFFWIFPPLCANRKRILLSYYYMHHIRKLPN